MKRFTIYGLAAVGTALLSLSAHAQITVTTSTNALPSPVSTPTIQPDTLRPNKTGMTMPQGDDRENRRERRENRGKAGASSTTNTNDYRQNAGNGPASNNSNTTNYNSNNAVAPASGVNAMPNNPSSTSGDTSNGTAGTTNGSTTTESTAAGSTAAGSTMGPTTASGSSAVSGAKTPGAVANPDRTVNSADRSKTLSVGDFIAASPNHTTLQNALQTTTLDKTLQGTGPFTVFAPSNEAFKGLPAQTQRVLLEGQNLSTLKTLLTNHVVAGEVDAAELMRRIKAGSGQATLQTVGGQTLTVQARAGGQLTITDEQGVSASINMPDHYETNGIVHGITKVLMPKNMTPFK